MALTRKQHALLATLLQRRVAVIGKPSRLVQSLLDERPRLIGRVPVFAMRGNTLEAGTLLWLTLRGQELASHPF